MPTKLLLSILLIEALAGCASAPPSPPRVSAADAYAMCTQLGYPPQSLDHFNCAADVLRRSYPRASTPAAVDCERNPGGMTCTTR